MVSLRLLNYTDVVTSLFDRWLYVDMIGERDISRKSSPNKIPRFFYIWAQSAWSQNW